MAELARVSGGFRTKEMQDILTDAIAFNDPSYVMRVEHRQIAIEAAWFILWLAYESVIARRLSSMLTDDIQHIIVQTLIHICEDRTGYYTPELI